MIMCTYVYVCVYVRQRDRVYVCVLFCRVDARLTSERSRARSPRRVGDMDQVSYKCVVPVHQTVMRYLISDGVCDPLSGGRKQICHK